MKILLCAGQKGVLIFLVPGYIIGGYATEPPALRDLVQSPTLP